MMTRFEESGMMFSFPDEDIYRIEKSEFLASVQMKACECIVKKGNNILLVEAKSSSPHPDKSAEKFHQFIEDIKKKFSDSLLFYNVMVLRQKEQGIGENLQSTDLREAKYQFVLIIKGHKKGWLPPLSDALKKEMRYILRLWNIEDVAVKVMNEEIAMTSNTLGNHITIDS